MFIRLEPSSGVPITRQMVDQIRALCAAGTLAAGDRMPSVRELARELAVNQNTILRVYERLTAEGLLERRHGAGTFVASNQPGGQMKLQRDALRDDVERLIRNDAVLGLDKDEVIRIVEYRFYKKKKSAKGKKS